MIASRIVKSVLLLCCLQIPACFAVRESRNMSSDSRIKTLVYSADDVFKFTGYYGYQTNIKLGTGEEILTLSLGDSTAWQIIPAGNRLFIKPIEEDATTNMTLITNKRSYLFEIHAEHAIDINDPNIAFDLRFIYPDEPDSEAVNLYSARQVPDLSHPENYNFNYSISGDDVIAPIKVFDDGTFTYIQFKKINAELPAIFAVDESLRENMINYSLGEDNTIVIERVCSKLAVRSGRKVVCIFNESFKEERKHTK